jgi:hypothetical protein
VTPSVASADSLPSPFKPSLARGGLAAAVALAAFFIPQEVPLEYYPLNHPGNDILYLEITCAADKPGDVQIFYNTTRGINQHDSISWPIAPSEHPYTYTFPLPDAPITELRIDPIHRGAALTIRQMRIIDRRGTQIQRFTKDQFIPLHEIAGISPLSDGWKIVSEPEANDPYASIELPSPLLAQGINHRNFLRCLYSWSYLGLMLWVVLLAILFTFHRPRVWRDLVSPIAFMALIAGLFSAVGNRGLIKNSFLYSHFSPPVTRPGFHLEIDLRIDHSGAAQLTWDTAANFTGTNSLRRDYEPHADLQTLRFPLPSAPLKALRFNPLDGEAQIAIREIRVVDAGNRTRIIVPLNSFLVQLEKFSPTLRRDAMETLEIKSPPGRQQLIMSLAPEAIGQINHTLQSPSGQ